MCKGKFQFASYNYHNAPFYTRAGSLDYIAGCFDFRSSLRIILLSNDTIPCFD